MKKLILIFSILSSSIIFPQTIVPPEFSELQGMEDQQGSTNLFYRIFTSGSGGMGYYYSNSIYRLEPATGVDVFFLGDGGFADQFDEVNDFAFWENDYNRYIYAGTHIYIEPFPLVFRYDQPDPIFAPQMWSVSRNIELSRQDTNIIIASFDYGINFISTDWGNNWDSLSIGYEILSLSPLNSNIIFAGQGLSLLKSTDGGDSFYMVDTARIYRNNFIYDVDELHIYAIDSRLGNHLVVSDNNGEPFSWSEKYNGSNNIFFSVDNSQSGSIYLADGKYIFHSTDFGNSFNLYKTLDRKIAGIYKKPNSNKLYAATKYKIYEITPDTIQIIKELPIPEETFAFYPLAVGNKWIYDEVTVVYDPYPNVYQSILVKEVLGDSIAPNGKHYYKVNDETIWEPSVLERVDSTEGRVYRYYEDQSLQENEYLAYDLLAEVGDTLLSYRMGFNTVMFTTMYAEATFEKWELTKPKKVFFEYTLHPPIFSLTQDIGLDSIYSYFDFGDTYITLKGCVLNGVVYGDTTTVGVNDETSNIPAKFSLSQNFPNPFNPTTVISYRLPVIGKVSIKVYDILGNEIATLVNEEKPAGEYEVVFDGANLSSGVYFYQLKTDSYIQTKKMILMK